MPQRLVQRRLGAAVEAQGQQREEEEAGMESPEKGVMLEPFVHQVGGHSCVLRLGDRTLCKPLEPREHRFYKSLPAGMRKFTPQYRGVVSVSFEENEEGNLCLIAYPLQNDPAADLEHKDPSAESKAERESLQWDKSMSLSPLVDKENYSKEGHRHSRKDKDKSIRELQESLEELRRAEVLYYRLERGHSSGPHTQLKHNPWSLQCQQEHLHKMKENAKHRNQYKFILLENLTWRHSMPCVLDLKMGTQQHGDDATEEKKALKIRKCQQSTASSIGIVLAGMQVYRSDTGQLMYMSKFHGQRLSPADFKEALYQFFHSGRRLRRELLSPVLRRLRDMRSALEACESYRFYASSLLVIYDGAEQSKKQPTGLHGEDGLSEEDEDEEEEEEEEQEDAQAETESEGEAGEAGFSHSPTKATESGSSSSRSPMVDVRMIDFAHTTCRHYQGDTMVHEGLDSGYLFGLQNLITIISELENNSTH